MSLLAAAGELGREAARRAARTELSDPRYRDAQPPLVVRVVGRVLRELGRLLARAADAAPGGALGLLLLAGLLVLAVVVLLTRLRPARTGAAGAVFAAGAPLPAAEHRRRAEQAAAAGDFAAAVRERLRAAVRALEEDDRLEPRPGRTASEVARDAGRAVPALAAPLAAAAGVFAEVWYGGRPADAGSYATVVAADRLVAGEPAPART